MIDTDPDVFLAVEVTPLELLSTRKPLELLALETETQGIGVTDETNEELNPSAGLIVVSPK